MAEEEAPKVVILTPEQTNRKLVIPFYSAIGATANLTLVSNAITHHYKITKVEAHFRDDTANNLQVYVFTSRNRNAPTTAPPPDTNLISRFSPTPYLVGQGQSIVIDCLYVPPFEETYIKVYFANANAYALSGHVLVTIESITEEEAQQLIEESRFKISANTPEEYYQELLNRSIAGLDIGIDTMHGTPVGLELREKLFKEETRAQKKTYTTRYMNALNIPYFTPVGMPLVDRHKTTRAWLNSALEISNELYTNEAFVGAVTSAFGINFTKWYQWFEANFGLNAKTRELVGIAVDKGIIKPVEYYWNKMYQPEIPSTADLINMAVKEKITVDEFKEQMTYQGFSKDWTDKIWRAHFRAPDYTEIRQSIWREGITHDEIPKYLKLVDLDPDYNEKVWYKLLEQIPPYQDLINMRVKEVIAQEEFSRAIQTHGYYPYWANKLWDAHFTPPQFMDFLTAMRRKEAVVIPRAEKEPELYQFGITPSNDINVIKELSILADYDPRYWDFFKTRIHVDPTPRQARWGYEAGALTEEEVYDITKRHGFKDEDAKWFTDFTLKFQERPLITRYINALMNAYLTETIDAEELKKRIVAIPRREAIAEWILKIADVRKEISANKPVKELEKLLSASQLKQLAQRNLMEEDELRDRLTDMGYNEEDIEYWFMISEPLDKAKEKRLSISELKQMFMQGIITEDEFRTDMMLNGFDVTTVQRLVDLYVKLREEKETGAQKKKLSVSEMLNAFKWWQITEEELKTDLMLRGLTLLETETLINTKKKQWTLKEHWTETEPVAGGV